MVSPKLSHQTSEQHNQQHPLGEQCQCRSIGSFYSLNSYKLSLFSALGRKVTDRVVS